METKKILAPMIAAIVTLVMITVGATYAYFTVTATSNFGTKTITATTPDLGSVALSGGSSLYLNLSRVNMMSANKGTYYAVTSSNGVATTTASETTIATATVTGAGTFSCDYTLNIAYDGTLKAALKKDGVAILKVNNTDYDIYSTTFPKTVTGSLTGLVAGTNKTITASLRFVNANEEQNELINKSMTLTFTTTAFTCTATA